MSGLSSSYLALRSKCASRLLTLIITAPSTALAARAKRAIRAATSRITIGAAMQSPESLKAVVIAAARMKDTRRTGGRRWKSLFDTGIFEASGEGSHRRLRPDGEPSWRRSEFSVT